MIKFNALILFLAISVFTSKGQEIESVKSDIVPNPADTVVVNPKKHFMIVSDSIGNVDIYRVDVHINGTFYKTYCVEEQVDVKLPDSVKEGDRITVKRKKRIAGWYKIKVKTVKFRYGTADSVVVLVTKKRRRVFMLKKRDIYGPPKIEW